jgi:hypothetical protein
VSTTETKGETETENLLYRNADMDPAGFRNGDIVEVQFTFAVVPVKGDKYRMLMVLRALTMLDCTHTMVCRYNKHVSIALTRACRNP